MDTSVNQLNLDWDMAYNRMGAVLALRPVVSRRKFMHLLGREWDKCHNPGVYKDELIAIFKDTRRHWPEMMGSDELAHFVELPARFTIYRGAPLNFINGLCWTLNVEVAESYRGNPWYDRPQYGRFTIGKAEVDKQDVVAFKGGRSESVIIVCDARKLNDLSFDWL